MSLVGNDIVVVNESGERLRANITSDRWPLVPGVGPDFQGGVQGPGGDVGFAFWNAEEGGMRLTVSCDGYETQQIVTSSPDRVRVTLKRAGAPPSQVGKLTASGPIFLSDGQPWRYKGVSAFGLANKFRNGENVDGFLNDYAGYNVLRVWDYTEAADGWGASAWDSIASDVWVQFCAYVAARGFHVELTLLTCDRSHRIARAKSLLADLKQARVPNLLVEAGNEPLTHKHIDVNALKSDLEQSGYLYSSGVYEDSDQFYGSYYVNHTPRNSQFPRYGHELLEAYDGKGPDKPHAPFLCPCVGDEPGKIQDLGQLAKDWRALFGGYAIMGAGGTFHSETGKYGDRPTVDELRMSQVVLEALNAFPSDAPRGAYRRIVEPGNEPGGPTESSRTYVVGNYSVRSQQVGTQFPEPGWTPIDADGVLWRQ